MPHAPIIELNAANEAVPIYQLMQQSYRVEAELLGLIDFYPLTRSVQDIAKSQHRFLGVLKEGKVLAVLELEKLDEQTLLVASLVVYPAAFRQGLASSLLEHILEQEDFQTLKVSTAAKNLPALRLYEKMGFCLSSSQTLTDGLELVTLEYQK